MQTTLTREIEDGDGYIEVEIEVDFRLDGRFIPASLVDPAEQPDLVVRSATRSDTGESVDLTDDEHDQLFELAVSERQALAEDAAEARAEYRREARDGYR
jgi:hypothetical protein